jgi:hypothetical protein
MIGARGEAEVRKMARKPSPDNPPCPRCGATHGIQNGSKGGRPRWVCRNCQRSFGPTLGTAMDRWRAPCGWGCAGGAGAPPRRSPATRMKPSPRCWSTTCTGARWRWMPSGLLSKKASGCWRSGRLGGRGGPAWGMLESGPGDSFWGGVGLWVFGGGGRAEGGGADPSTHAGSEGRDLDP